MVGSVAELDRRTQIAVGCGIGVALVALAAILLFVYPFSTADPQPAGDTEQLFDAPLPDAEPPFTLETTFESEETVLHSEFAITASGEAYYRFESVEPGGPNVTREKYQRNAMTYVRYEFPAGNDERAEAFREDHDVVAETRTDGHLVLTGTTSSSLSVETTSGVETLLPTTLATTYYDQVDEGAAAGTRTYEPQTGWFSGSRDYRIIDASGDVTVDADTYELQSVDVSWVVHDFTSNYFDYYVGGESYSQELTLAVDRSEPEIETPEWVESVEASGDS